MLHDQINLDTLWEDFDFLCIKECTYNDTVSCKHESRLFDTKEGSEVCQLCGEIIGIIYETQEWNSYKNETGQFNVSCQRGETFKSDNPYDKGGSIPGFNKNSFAMRLHYQQTFSHKQKTYWQISERFQDYISRLCTSNVMLSTAKNMWHICMESGKLTRASIRNGLISSCFYYACIYKNVPIDRQKVIDLTDGNQKGFLKGEKIFLELMENTIYKNLGKQRLDIKENDSFVKYCNKLELPFSYGMKCNEIFTQCGEILDSVTPKSAVAGIIFFVIKYHYNLNKPSKTKISNETDVCIPTINKVVSILQTNIKI